VDARDVAVLLLVPFAALAFLDGVYLHLWRLRLYAQPESRREHALHTARALLFPPLLLLLFAREAVGPLLALAVALAVADTILEAWDTLEEPRSRAALGGLSRAESLLHVVLISLRAAALALAFTSTGVEPWHETLVVQGLLPGAVFIAALHVALALRAGATRSGTHLDVRAEEASS
jgi:hypothetical protein